MGIAAPAGVSASGIPSVGDKANAVLQGVITALGPTQPFAFRGPMNLAIWASINTALTTTLASLSATVGSGTGLAAGIAVNSTLVPPGTVATVVSGTSLTLKAPPVTLYGLLQPNSNLVGGLFSTGGLLGATVTAENTAVALPSGTTVTAIVQAAIPPGPGFTGAPGIVQLSNAFTKVPTQPLQVPLKFAVTANAILAGGTDNNATFTGAAIVYVGTVQVERSFDGGSTWIVCNVGGSGQLAQYNAGTPVDITFGEPEREVLYRLNCIAYSSGTINFRISQTGAAAESLAIGQLT